MKFTSILAVIAAFLFITIGGAQALQTSVTGTVVSSTSDRVVVNTPTGEMTFKFTPLVDRPSEMPVGSRLTVYYDPADTGIDNMNKASRIVTASTTTTERTPAYSDERTTTGTTSMTGTVVSSTSDRLVIRTATGEETFRLSANMDRPTTFTAGKQVTVWYDPATVPGETDVHMATRVTTMDEGTGRMTDRTGTTYESDTEDQLPATAGPLPLLAWIGLSSLGGGIALKMVSRRKTR